MLKKVYDGSISYVQIMDEYGNVDASLRPDSLGDDKIIDMYKWMSYARALDTKVLSLQRQGRAATYAPLVGQEAEQIGSALAMRKQDYFVPNFRQHGVYLARGYPLDTFFLYWKGYEEGAVVGKEYNALPPIVPVATQTLHAAGIAYAQKFGKTNAVVVTYVGDGGTSEGNFYESLNFAGEFNLPLVTIIENNEWAISEPEKNQTAAPTLAQKAIGAGIPGVQVDGNDVIGVYKVVSDAIANAAAGKGPMLIEALTYRMSMHTTADDPTKYRDDKEVTAWKPRDPILRVKTYLTKKNLWNDKLEQQMADEQLKKIDEAVDKAEQFKPDPRSMFEHVYSFMPETLKQEEDAAIAENFWQTAGGAGE